MRRVLITSSAAVLATAMHLIMTQGHGLCAEQEVRAHLRDLRQLQPENIARDSRRPSDIFQGLCQLDRKFVDTVGCSEASEDMFFEAYAEALGKATDSQYPNAVTMRGHLLKAFQQVHEFLGRIYGRGGHVAARLPGNVEWVLNSGLRSGGKDALSTYALDDIRMIGKLIARTHWRECLNITPDTCHDPDTAWQVSQSRLEDALRELADAEADAPDPLRQYFRAALVHFMACCL